ncbi:RHS repeat-associated core domain-containing protein [Prauserella flavalba]|uniref:RHS repeat-associated core domain-containing protein n=1 Tax=Prauserella flavalba TaxID=1477506 RepID=UPI0036EBAB52
MGNPLVAEVQDSTEAFSGIPLLESVNDTTQAIESGEWAGAVLGAVGAGLDALGMAMDPFGAILSAGVGWLMEHVGPLSNALDGLTGDPDTIKAHSETWKTVSTELTAISGDLRKLIEEDTASWTGPAADAYRERGADTATLITAAQTAADGASSGIGTAGEVVGAVRTLVRDIIADLVGHMISWALQVLLTLGIGMAWVVPQVVAAVAKTATQIADITKKLVDALSKLSPLLRSLGDSFGDAAAALKRIKDGRIDTPPPVRSGPEPEPRDTDFKGDKYEGPGSTGGQTNPSGDRGGGGTVASGDPGRTDPPPPPRTDPPRNEPPPRNDVAPPPPPPPARQPKTGGDTTTASSVKPDPARQRSVQPENRNCKGDPVDVATGEVILPQTDLELPELLLERVHVSSYRAGRRFGPSWASTVDQRLELDGTDVCFVGPDGVVLVYPLPAAGDTVLPAEGPRWPLSRHADGGFTLVQPVPGRTLHFAGAGRVLPLRAVEDADGARTEFAYDDTGAPALLTHSSGIRVGLRTDCGRVVELSVLGADGAPDVRVLTYRYDAAGRLTEVVNSSGLPLRYDYDAEARLTGWQDRNGVWYRYVYDSAGRCVRTVGAGGFLDATFEYDRQRGLTRHTDSLGHTSVSELNDAGQTVRETDPLGNVTSFAWDRYDRLLSRTDPLGRVTRYAYDDEGRPLRITRPDGSVLTVEDGNPVAVAVHGDGRVWRRFYADGAAPDPVREPVGVATAGLPEPQPAAGPDPVERDQFGRPRAVREAGGELTLLGWTVDGRRASRTGPRRERALWRYDGEGNETEHVDELGRVTRREYGPFDLLTAVTDPAGARTVYAYDTELRLVSVTDPLGRTWTFRYDAAGRPAGQTDFDGRSWSYGYDAAGQLVRAQGPDGGVTGYRYDLLGNLVEVHAPEGVTTYAYDPVGEVVRVASATSVVEFDRDEYGRVVRETVDGLAVTFAYDDGRNTIRRRTPSGAESEWSFDEQGRPIALATAGHTVRFLRDDHGRAIARKADEASVLRQAFGPGGRLTAQRLLAASGPMRGRGFEYQLDGRLAAVRDDEGPQLTLSRDLTGRVVAMSTVDGREELRYDPAGNLVSSSAVRVAVEHDALGRRVRHREAHPDGERVWEYSWSGERLTGVRTPEGLSWRYHYDPLGRRVAKECLLPDGSVAESVRFVWDGTELIEQVHADAHGVRRATTWERVPGEHTPVTQLERGPAGQRFHSVVTDALGTPTDLVDEHGDLAWSSRRTLWGRELPSPGARAGTPLRFPGQYADAETGLHYNVFRYYDPATARYVSQDPLGLEPGPNPVAYVADPFAEFDALGLMNSCTTPSAGGKTPPVNLPIRQHARNSGGSAPSPNPGGGGRKRKNDGGGTQPSAKKSKTKSDDPWDRPEFKSSTQTNIKHQKNDPNNPAYQSGGQFDKRHIVSFQTMRDNLRSWVDQTYPPGTPEHKAATEKYVEKLKDANSNVNNLPLGPGKPNTSIGATVDKFDIIQSKIDGTHLGKDGVPEPPKDPRTAFYESSGYLHGIRNEFAGDIMAAADKISDPARRQEFLDDVRFNADFDWPGGTPAQLEDWKDARRQWVDLGRNPDAYTSADVDAMIDRFNNMDAPGGSHGSLSDWENRPGSRIGGVEAGKDRPDWADANSHPDLFKDGKGGKR